VLVKAQQITVAPEFGSVALAIGDEDPEGVAVHIDEPTSDCAFVFTDAFADGEKFVRSRRALELPGEAHPSVVFIDGYPSGESGGLALRRLGEAGDDDVGNPARFEESERRIFEKPWIGPHGA
jgi:hypothetical protein